MKRITSLLPLLGALAIAALLLSAPVARAGDDQECLSSKLANELMDCAHCNAVKKLLSHRAIGKVDMEVHALESGAILQIEARHASAVKLVHDLVNELWKPGMHCETTLSQVCVEREHMLGKVAIDRALTDHGALVVLRASSDEVVSWLLQDARDTRSYLLAAASR